MKKCKYFKNEYRLDTILGLQDSKFIGKCYRPDLNQHFPGKAFLNVMEDSPCGRFHRGSGPIPCSLEWIIDVQTNP